MKARPRRFENSTADLLSGWFKLWGFSAVDRQPVIGREGPDLTMNELKIAVDCKTRLEVPQTIFFPLCIPFQFDDYIGVRLQWMDSLLKEPVAPLDFHSTLVANYWKHMDEWTKQHCPDGISAVVLHRPKMPIGDAVFVIHQSDKERFTKRCQPTI